jgi:electron transport complex protein RnfE
MIKDFTNGILKENPVFIILLGLCPALAVSNQVINALGMGVAVIFVLLGSNLTVSLLKSFIPDRVRIPCYLIIIAFFVTLIDLIMKAYAPFLSDNLGIFVPLIAINCIILGRAEAFAIKNSLKRVILDACGMGCGFTLALTLIAFIREVFGAGKITLFAINEIGFNGEIIIPVISDWPIRVIAYPAGAFFVLGLLKALINVLSKRKKGI